MKIIRQHLKNNLQSDIWKNKRCFLIGGGPSLIDFNPKLLKNELTIGVNKAFIKFNPTINYSMDPNFQKFLSKEPCSALTSVQEQWRNYKGVKVFLKTSSKYIYNKNIFLIQRIRDKRKISYDPNIGIIPGKCSGFGALMLAISLGCKEIYLLGYDLDVQNNLTHWHEGYKNQTIEKCLHRLKRFKANFNEYSEILRNEGIQIVNLNLDSKLECFPKDSIENIL